MSDTVLAQIAALKGKSTPELRDMWKELFGQEAPVLGRRYLEDRLAYRVQELRFGGLSDRARRKLDALADQLEPKAARRRDPGRPIAGTGCCASGKVSSTSSPSESMISSTRAARTGPSRRSRGRSRSRDGTAGRSLAFVPMGRPDDLAGSQGPLRDLLPQELRGRT